MNASKVGVYGCYITGYQDTLYARYGTQYYSNCLIEGAADYIYGDASAWFGECTIQSTAAGFITAMGRATNDEATWYAFDHSTIQGKSGVSLTKKVWLGRPWRVFARVIYQNSVLTDIIQPEGWTTMAEGATPLYYEINNTGAGSSTSSRKYETKISAAVTKTIVLGSDYATWIDGSY